MRRFLQESHESSTHESSTEEGVEFGEYIAFGVIPLAMTLGVLTRLTIAKWLPIPYTVLLLLWGCVFGAIYTELETPFNVALDNAITAWINMDPRMLQVVFFPILIFASAFNAQFHILERRLGQILFLALPGVLLGASLTAIFIKLVLPYDWEWNLCFVFGSMVAATDPVAVVALLEELGVSEKLGTLIEGESLLNDGSAIVVFEVFLEAIEGKERNWLEIIGFGARLALGGPAIGAALGLMGASFLGYVLNDALVEVTVTVVLAYSSFALCEDTSVKVSGVLGIVACGVVLSYYGKPRVSSPVLPSLINFWKTLQFFADTIIFFLSGLIVVGVAINDRSITGADFGYLLALFAALYVIRGIVVIFAYPVLRSGEYKITVPQMMVLTHSGLRGAVALILALVVDGVHEIDLEQRDKIVFLTAGVAVLSLLFNGTTTGPLVRFLKLDRASEASEGVFSNACFALELSMEKQQLILQEDPFLSDANWNLVWRYIPIFTAESYWHRLSKSNIALSKDEVKDIRNNNSCTLYREKGMVARCRQWVSDRAGFNYRDLPHRLRSPWYAHHHKYLFADAGGESVWGDLETFLANHTTHGDTVEAWSGHLKHNTQGGRSYWASPAEFTGKAKAAAAAGAAEEADVGMDADIAIAVENGGSGSGGRGAAGGNAEGYDEEEKTTLVVNNKDASDNTITSTNRSSRSSSSVGDKGGASEGVRFKEPTTSPPPEEALEASRQLSKDGDGGEGEDVSRALFQRATSMVRAAGIDVSLTEKDEAEGDVDKCALEEARLRFLCALKAEYFKGKREGKLGSSGLRVLTEAMNYSHDRVEKGQPLSGWTDLKDQFKTNLQMSVAKYMNWWPARPLMAAAIARRVSFQMELAWNFLEAHHESVVKVNGDIFLGGLLAAVSLACLVWNDASSLLSDHGKISRVQRQVNRETQKQIKRVERTIARLMADAPMVTRSVKTRTAARVMIQRFREATELLAENGHLDEKEEEVLMMGATEAELWIAYHPNLERLPPLPAVLEKIAFLAELTDEERKQVIDARAATYEEYVGEVKLIEMGKLGSCGFKKGEGTSCSWFFVIRGQVERNRMVEDGGIESDTHSSGMLFGITDAMLEIPHHAGYTTYGFSNLVVFDREKILKLAQTIPTLDKSLWKAVAAHCLRRNIRFHTFKLQSCHRLVDKAEFLSGKKGPEDEEVFEMEEDDAIVVVRGRIIAVDETITVTALGRADTSVAPVLLEPADKGKGGSVRVSGDYKMFKMASDTLADFSRDEKDRMFKRESMKRAMSMSTVFSEKGGADERHGLLEDSRENPLTAMMQEEMSNFNVRPRANSFGVKAAMKLMAGVEAPDKPLQDGGDVDDDGDGDVGGESLIMSGVGSTWGALSSLFIGKNARTEHGNDG